MSESEHFYLAYDPDVHLSDQLELLIDNYSGEFRTYWGLDAAAAPKHLDDETWKTARLFDRIAKLWFEAATSLQPPSAEIDVSKQVALLHEAFGEDLRENFFVTQWVEVELASERYEALHRRRYRAIGLLERLVPEQQLRTREYLYRVANCYIYGLEPEGVVMCRAVLDVALQELVDAKAVVEAGHAKHDNVRWVDLDDRLRNLKRTGRLTQEEHDAAERVRDNGNYAVHNAPGQVNLDDVLDDLVTVLRALESVS